MIVLNDKRLVLIVPAGCNARHIHHTLGERKRAIWVEPVEGVQIPREFITYRRAVVARNPFTRAVDLFDKYNLKREAANLKRLTLKEYIDNLPTHKQHYSQTIKGLIKDVEPVEVYQYERLRKHLNEATGITAKFNLPEVINWRKRWYRCGSETITHFRQWVFQDIFLLGYKDKAISEIEALACGGKYD